MWNFACFDIPPSSTPWDKPKLTSDTWYNDKQLLKTFGFTNTKFNNCLPTTTNLIKKPTLSVTKYTSKYHGCPHGISQRLNDIQSYLNQLESLGSNDAADGHLKKTIKARVARAQWVWERNQFLISICFGILYPIFFEFRFWKLAVCWHLSQRTVMGMIWWMRAFAGRKQPFQHGKSSTQPATPNHGRSLWG